MSDTLRRLQELHQAATPAPWEADAYDDEAWILNTDLGPGHKADVALIAAMRNTLPALLDIAEAAGPAYRKLKTLYDEDAHRLGQVIPDDECWAEAERLADALAALEDA